MTRKVKCGFCGKIDATDLLVRDKNMKFYHKESCYNMFLKEREFIRREKDKKASLVKKIVDIYELGSLILIPPYFHPCIEVLRNGDDLHLKQKQYKMGVPYEVIESAYEFCKEKIQWARNNKEFKDLKSELVYGLSIVKNHIYDSIKNSELKRIDTENTELVLSEEQKTEIQSYKVESPIEEKLLTALLYNNPDKELIELDTQKVFEINNRNYRVDFLIKSNNKNFIVMKRQRNRQQEINYEIEIF